MKKGRVRWRQDKLRTALLNKLKNVQEQKQKLKARSLHIPIEVHSGGAEGQPGTYLQRAKHRQLSDDHYLD